MNYSVIKPVDIADGPGVRVSVFVSGCRNHCKGCFQPETWDFNYGQPFDMETIRDIIHLMKHDYISGLTVLGGDPMEPENLPSVKKLCKSVKFVYPHKNVWVYTGYLFEGLPEGALDDVDVLVDGRFVEEKKNLCLRFRGSENQRIIDVKKSREAGKVVLWEDEP